MLSKVLVPLDGGELAEGILPYVQQLAKGLEAPVVLLSVLDSSAVETHPRLEDDGDELRRAEAEVRRSLDEVAQRLAEDDVEARATVVVGKPAEQIVRMVEEEGCDLIAMSTHGRTALGRGILGSVTDRVIHSSHVPILTITPDRAKEYWHAGDTISSIMVPLDGSDLAEEALPYARHLAKTMSLEVMLVRVAQLASTHAPFSAALAASEAVDVDAELKARAGEYLGGVAAV